MKRVITIFSAILAYSFSFDVSAQISTYCASNATSVFDSKIDSVALNDIQQGSSPTTCETYTDNTNMSTTLNPGSIYTIYIKNGSCGSYYTNYKRAWIDFNHNGVFDDPSERIIDVTTSSALQLQSDTFLVPASATSGATFMRVVSSESSNPSPCGTYSWGETEDYSIMLFDYCASNATSTLDSKIDNVTLNTINNSSSPTSCETYTDFLNISTTLEQGQSYTMSVKNGSCGNYYTNYKRAWIDFNQNGVF